MLPALLSLPGKLSTLLARLTADRATKLDNLAYLDASIATRSTLTAAQASAQVWAETSRSLTTGTGRGVFLTSGTAWTVPVGVSHITVTVCGGGGGGGGGYATNTTSYTGGGGGGAAGVLHKQPLIVTPGASLAYTIGAAGLGGAIATAGTAGGSSTIGQYPLQYIAGGGGGGAAGAYNSTPGGSSGSVNSALIGWTGETGDNGGSVSGVYGGSGKSTAYGAGGAGGGTLAIAGTAATGWGASGGGGGRQAAGANGAPGFILIEY